MYCLWVLNSQSEIGEAIELYPNALVPDYLSTHYWWAYIHPKAVKLFERQWLVNLILWGNYARLRDAALAEMGESLSGRTLQVACAYGDLTNCLSQRATIGGGSIDIVDVLPIQLKNLRGKLLRGRRPRLLAMDAIASQAARCQLRPGTRVFSASRAAARMARANAE